MKYKYKLKIRFHGKDADQSGLKGYDRLASAYDTIKMTRNEQEKTSKIIISSRTKLTRRGIEKILGAEIPIISFKKME
jgi:hypothetical protein